MIVAGFGFRTGANLYSLCSAYQQAREGAPPVTHIATSTDKAHLLAELANLLDLPLLCVSPDRLRAVETMTASAAALTARGVGSLAEASALGVFTEVPAMLLAPRHISKDRMATCAIAQGSMT